MKKKNFVYLFIYTIIMFSFGSLIALPSFAQSPSLVRNQNKSYEEKALNNKNDGKGIGGTGSPLNDLNSADEDQNTVGEFDYSFAPLPDLTGTDTSGTSGNPPGEEEENSNIAPQNSPQNNLGTVVSEGESHLNNSTHSPEVSEPAANVIELPSEVNILDGINVAPPETPILPEEFNSPDSSTETGGGFNDGLSVSPPDIGIELEIEPPSLPIDIPTE